MIKALVAAGYEDLASLNGVDYADLIALAGVGPRTLERVQEQLVAQDMSLGWGRFLSFQPGGRLFVPVTPVSLPQM